MPEKPTYLYPEHLVSAYILFKSRNNDRHITPKEVDSIIPELVEKKDTIRLMRISYRSTATDRYSPETRMYFQFLLDTNQAIFRHEEETQITRQGIEYAESVMGKLLHEDPSAVNELECALEKVSKTWERRSNAA